MAPGYLFVVVLALALTGEFVSSYTSYSALLRSRGTTSRTSLCICAAREPQGHREPDGLGGLGTSGDAISARGESLRDAKRMFLLLSGALGLTAATALPTQSRAAQGAFEMDMQFYAKNLLGQKPTPGVAVKRPIFKSPRSMDKTFARSIVDLVGDRISALSGSPRGSLESLVDSRIEATLKYFRTFAPITATDVGDQYYFDMVLYLYYLEAAKLLPTSERRVGLRDAVGDGLLALMREKYNVDRGGSGGSGGRGDTISAGQGQEQGQGQGHKQGPTTATAATATAAAKMKALGLGVEQILGVFRSTGVIGDYQFDMEDLADFNYAEASFAEVRHKYVVCHI
jgi:hypothetical protein